MALGKGRGYRHHVNATNHVVARMCSVSYEDDVTLEEHPVLLPAVPMVAAGDGEVLRGWPRGRETITRLKLDVRALDELWRQATNESERFALLPLGLDDWFLVYCRVDDPDRRTGEILGWSAATTLSEHVPDDHGAGTWRSVCIDFPGTALTPGLPY